MFWDYVISSRRTRELKKIVEISKEIDRRLENNETLKDLYLQLKKLNVKYCKDEKEAVLNLLRIFYEK